MFEDLDALLKQAKREAHFRKERAAKSKALQPKVAIKRQAEMDWRPGKTVCLIHKSPDGTETALGLFTEYLRNGSRWLRPSADTLSPDHTEIVTGSWWLHPSIREIPVDSPSEVQAIRARFETLIREFEIKNNLPSIFAERPLEDDEDYPEDDDEDGLELEFDDDEEDDWDEDDEDWDEDEE